MYCLPKLVDCAAGQTCPAGWSCFDFSNVGGIPPAWGSIASNKACLPDGIILAEQGHAASGGGGTLGVSEATGGDPTPSPVIPVPPTQGGATDSAGGETSAAAQSSGCAYGGSGAGRIGLWLAMAMTGLVARLARRRNRDR
jgi:hypothetical protein